MIELNRFLRHLIAPLTAWAVAGGILFFTDRVGGVDFNTNQMALAGAYHKALDRRSTQYLSAGWCGVSCYKTKTRF